MMERLTRNNRGFFELCEDTRTCNKICEENEECTDECVIQKAINKLGEYEDLEEQGLLLRLPCKIGDTLYAIRELFDGKETKVIEEIVVRRFDLRALQRFVIASNGHRLNFSNFGKTVFLTREAAEQALNNAKKGA